MTAIKLCSDQEFKLNNFKKGDDLLVMMFPVCNGVNKSES